MARTINLLTAIKVERTNTPGIHHDGGGLYLQVSPSGTKSWFYRFTLHKRTRDMGLGPFPLYSLAEARTRATEARKLRHDGIDPIDRRNAGRAAVRLEAAKAMTFDQCVAGFVTDHQAGWTPKHTRLWLNSIRDHASQELGRLSVSAIDVGLVLKVLKPIWVDKHPTAKNVRERIEAVLDWATVHKYRTGDNPARWKGHLDNILPKPADIHSVEHRATLPYAKINDLITELQARDDRDARCLLLLILTATRVDAAARARAEEFDLSTGVWTIPADRMKRRGKRRKLGFRIPLSAAAIELVKSIGVTEGPLFPGATDHSLTRAHGRDDITTHGFRSTFRDWAGERTAFPHEVIEMAMGHVVAGETEEAYFRSDLLDKRRLLMDAWAGYCARPATGGEVVPLRASA
jgi:integrase